ncbi:MAG: two-component system chemotaxis sensor kinase CheA [Pseudoalteromonas tetraodonis]|jgi:two-component system chemotaxis sensor kinase CheA
MNEMSEYLQMFLDETGEQLDSLVDVLLVLEREPGSTEEINEAFRLIHSIKGAAGMMGFDSITVLTHQLENRFEALRLGSVRLDKPTMNLILRCVDFLHECVQRLRDGEQLGSTSELVQELATLSEETKQTTPLSAAEPNPGSVVEPPESLATSPMELPDDLVGYSLTVHFEPGLPMADLKARLIISRLSQLGEIISTWPTVEELETAEVVSPFQIVLTSEQSAEAIRTAVDLDGVLSVELTDGTADHSSDTASSAGEPEPAPETRIPESKTTSDPESGVTTSAASPAEKASAPDAERSRPKGTNTMRVDIDRLDSLLNLAGELVVNRARFVQVAGQVAPAFRKRSVVTRARDFGESLSRIIEHLQKFNDGNGELTRDIEELKAGLALNEEQTELWNHGCNGFAQISEAIDQLTRISDSFRLGVLATRMVPVGPLFNRFQRVVRDVSIERGKTVNLSTLGEKTELDKRMIDELGDPLIHLVRNAIDHGIESPDVRRSRGKSEAGTIFMDAIHRGNNVIVSIRDDGGGIDPARIREKIAERGLLTQTEITGLSDEEARDYIWHPGFSTAPDVTDISGRGVGMDAVRARISELSGTINVESVLEQGTTFTVRLPLTLAIIKSLLIGVRKEIFSIPIDDVREIVKISEVDVVRLRDRQTIDVRGEFIPLIRIADVFHWHDVSYTSNATQVSKISSDDDSIDAVIVQVGDRAIALQVDELLGSQEIVIKSLSENYVQIRGLSGASILGDGTVCLMLDVDTVINLALASNEMESIHGRT